MVKEQAVGWGWGALCKTNVPEKFLKSGRLRSGPSSSSQTLLQLRWVGWAQGVPATQEVTAPLPPVHPATPGRNGL